MDLFTLKSFLLGKKKYWMKDMVLVYEKSREPLQLCFFHNMLWTYTKDFPWKKVPQISQILKGFFFQIVNFMNKLQQRSVNIERVFFPLLSYLVCNQVYPGYNMLMIWEAVKKVCLKICSTCSPMYWEKALWTCNMSIDDSSSATCIN
jgi:hypothetical protein